ncbi:hypothetical protein L484_005440 [Morus notabilis]|uniref:Trafficking protein particle complex subunit 5 n=1 Tax=Morus notabilis TaxID=981085 RepID=W9RC51_9ROSA|nr:hypothetical protein L484_005440 [Morus notabilis]
MNEELAIDERGQEPARERPGLGLGPNPDPYEQRPGLEWGLRKDPQARSRHDYHQLLSLSRNAIIAEQRTERADLTVVIPFCVDHRRRSVASIADSYPSTYVVLSLSLFCVNRRRQFVASAADSSPSPVYHLRVGDSSPVLVSLSAFAFLFSELVQYNQTQVDNIAELERRLEDAGYAVGARVLELLCHRIRMLLILQGNRRETRLLGILSFVHSTVWKVLFGKVADSLEKGTEHEDEYMISEKELLVNRFISIPKDMGTFNCGAFVAGIVRGVLDSAGFPAVVTAHFVPIEGQQRPRTTILIKFAEEREITPTCMDPADPTRADVARRSAGFWAQRAVAAHSFPNPQYVARPKFRLNSTLPGQVRALGGRDEGRERPGGRG